MRQTYNEQHTAQLHALAGWVIKSFTVEQFEQAIAQFGDPLQAHAIECINQARL